MPVPFGFGISDFVATGQLAWRIYLSCKAAPGVFGIISMELESLHCVLEEAADTQLSHPLPPQRQARLKTILDGCTSVLADLQYIVQKYHSLGTDEKSSWDRLRLGGEDIAEIRSRLVFNITLLTAFRSIVIGTTLVEGQSLPKREYGSWQWVVELSGPEAVESPKSSTSPSISNGSFSRSETDTTTLVDVQQGVLSPPPPPPTPNPRSRPRLASLATGFSSRKKRLISAIDNKDLPKALSILNDDSTTDILDQEMLDHALWSSARFPSTPLMEALLTLGANVNAVRDKKPPVLFNAVTTNNTDAVRLLLSKGANISPTPLRAALRSTDAIMTLLAHHPNSPLDAENQITSTIRLTILQEAITLGLSSTTSILLSAGAKIDTCSSTHGTALMIALSMGREALAKQLIQRGANVNFTRPSSPPPSLREPSSSSSAAAGGCTYTNPVEAAILGRKPSLLELLFRAGAVTDMPQAMRFAQANSDYPLIPGAGSQYGYYNDGTRKFYSVMVMLAQRDLRYVCFFRKDDRMEVKREGIRRMMGELCK